MVTLTAVGASGATYGYALNLIGDSWFKVPLNYMFGRFHQGIWLVSYIGETGNAATRFCPHERWDEAVQKFGVTHVLNHISSPDEAVRQREERDLILAHNPPLNVQHRPKPLPLPRGFGGPSSPAQSALAQALLRRRS